MPIWAWVLSILAGLTAILLLALALFRVRYHLEWRGVWAGGLNTTSDGTAKLRFSFAGFLVNEWEPLKDKSWSLGDIIGDDDPDDDDYEKNRDAERKREAESNEPEPMAPPAPRPAPRTQSVPLESRAEKPAFLNPEAPRPDFQPDSRPRDPAREEEARTQRLGRNKKRRALFRLLTDRDAWKLLIRYGLKTARLVLRLLKPRVEVALGDPDSARLGRIAGRWYALRPVLPLGRTEMYFRFQDRHPSLWVKVEGGFSALSAVLFGIRLLLTFPAIRLARRGLHGWRQHRLTGWRAKVYRKLQTLG